MLSKHVLNVRTNALHDAKRAKMSIHNAKYKQKKSNLCVALKYAIWTFFTPFRIETILCVCAFVKDKKMKSLNCGSDYKKTTTQLQLQINCFYVNWIELSISDEYNDDDEVNKWKLNETFDMNFWVDTFEIWIFFVGLTHFCLHWEFSKKMGLKPLRKVARLPH